MAVGASDGVAGGSTVGIHDVLLDDDAVTVYTRIAPLSEPLELSYSDVMANRVPFHLREMTVPNLLFLTIPLNSLLTSCQYVVSVLYW